MNLNILSQIPRMNQSDNLYPTNNTEKSSKSYLMITFIGGLVLFFSFFSVIFTVLSFALFQLIIQDLVEGYVSDQIELMLISVVFAMILYFLAIMLRNKIQWKSKRHTAILSITIGFMYTTLPFAILDIQDPQWLILSIILGGLIFICIGGYLFYHNWYDGLTQLKISALFHMVVDGSILLYGLAFSYFWPYLFSS